MHPPASLERQSVIVLNRVGSVIHSNGELLEGIVPNNIR